MRTGNSLEQDRKSRDDAQLEHAVPAEIFLDPEQASQHRLQAKYTGNVYTIPRLRIIGLTLIALVGVPLHNIYISHDFQFQSFLSFLIIVELYCTATWLLLYAYYDEVKAIDLGDLFLYTDLFILAGAVYVTGGDKSWFFWLPVMRVADQVVHGFRRCISFTLASTAVFSALWLYLLLVEQRPVDLVEVIAKTTFVAVAGIYIALTSRAASRVRGKLVSAIRFARHAIAQLSAKSDELIEARSRAEQASQSKSEFLARVSHELRRPATTVIGFAQLLEMTELTPKQRDYAARILRSGQDLGILIDEVMDLADLQSGMLTMTPTNILLGDLVEETLAHVWPLAAARGVRLISAEDVSGHDVCVWADRRALRRALLNAVAHVIRYSGADDRVAVSWSRRGEYARIEVRDSGPGILAEPVEELLSTPTRPDDDLARMQELGLGLAFTKRLVVDMHGRVGADLEIGQGTTYWINLPVSGAIAAEHPLTPAFSRG